MSSHCCLCDVRIPGRVTLLYFRALSEMLLLFLDADVSDN